MTIQWFSVFLLILLLWKLEVGAVYHEPSMKTFNKPSELSNGSLFSYSIAYQSTIKKLITSAPKFGTGFIYECDIETTICDEIEVNRTKENIYGDMWLGASVATGHNFTMACAPRYKEWKSPELNYTKLGTFGRCYSMSSASVMMSEMPTAKVKEDSLYYERNMDSFGWSTNVDENDDVLVGGPAMNTGRVLAYGKSPDPKLFNARHFEGLQVKFNFGYSITSGNFFTVEDILYAISSPYGENGNGMVILTNLKNITSNSTEYWNLPNPRWHQPAVGSLFGAAMAAATLRGKGQRQALLVGAPRYAPYGKGRVDMGVVYIYQYDLETQKIVHQKTILGKIDNAQLGSAIISLGDLDGDEKDEIAVSAPYEDSGRGAVYIYSAKHLLSNVTDDMLQYLQRIQPEGFRAFGLSLTALQDYDNNGCNEIAIGAPHSDKFVVLKCMANIILKVQKLRDRKRVNDTYFVYQSCMNFVFPEKPEKVTFDILLKISIPHKEAELVNAGEKTNVIEHQLTFQEKKTQLCLDVGIIIPKRTGYKPSVQYQITATQINSPAINNTFEPSRVLLSDLSVLNLTATEWVADCAGSGVCNPEFKVSIQTTLKDGYIIGSSDTENLTFIAINSGDVAYETCAVVDISGVRTRKYPPTCKLIYEKLGCEPYEPVDNNTSWQSEQIELDMTNLRSNVNSITISVIVYPHCTNAKAKFEKSERTFKLLPDYDGVILKRSTKDIIELTNEELMESGKPMSHKYTVYNNGMTYWVNLRCEIVIRPEKFYKDISVFFLVELHMIGQQHQHHIHCSDPMVDTQASYECADFTTNKNGMYVSTCVIAELRKNHKFDVIISIVIEPGKINADDLDDDNNHKQTVNSRLLLKYDNKQQEKRIVSTLKLKEAVVPIWIVIIAALIGLLIIVIIVFALYECGFLRRKNRDKLKRLRKNVHRQSIRRSMAVRESLRASAAERRSGDREKLIEVTDSRNEKAETDLPKQTEEITKNDKAMMKTDTEMTKKDTDLPTKDIEVPNKATEVLKKHTKEPKKDTEMPNKSTEVPKTEENLLGMKTEQPNDSYLQDTEQPIKVADKCKIIKNEQIIRGLQKNLVANRSLTHLPVTPKEAKNSNSLDSEI